MWSWNLTKLQPERLSAAINRLMSPAPHTGRVACCYFISVGRKNCLSRPLVCKSYTLQRHRSEESEVVPSGERATFLINATNKISPSSSYKFQLQSPFS